jgi:hypothetical protein
MALAHGEPSSYLVTLASMRLVQDSAVTRRSYCCCIPKPLDSTDPLAEIKLKGPYHGARTT